MTEAGPTFTQPTLTAARGSAFITASYELFDDYEGLVVDLAQLIADGRDTVDRDTEIAIELLCEHAAAALERLGRATGSANVVSLRR